MSWNFGPVLIESRSDTDWSAIEGIIYALSTSEQMDEHDQNRVQRLVELLIT